MEISENNGLNDSKDDTTIKGAAPMTDAKNTESDSLVGGVKLLDKETLKEMVLNTAKLGKIHAGTDNEDSESDLAVDVGDLDGSESESDIVGEGDLGLDAVDKNLDDSEFDEINNDPTLSESAKLQMKMRKLERMQMLKGENLSDEWIDELEEENSEKSDEIYTKSKEEIEKEKGIDKEEHISKFIYKVIIIAAVVVVLLAVLGAALYINNEIERSKITLDPTKDPGFCGNWTYEVKPLFVYMTIFPDRTFEMDLWSTQGITQHMVTNGTWSEVSNHMYSFSPNEESMLRLDVPYVTTQYAFVEDPNGVYAFDKLIDLSNRTYIRSDYDYYPGMPKTNIWREMLYKKELAELGSKPIK